MESPLSSLIVGVDSKLFNKNRREQLNQIGMYAKINDVIQTAVVGIQQNRPLAVSRSSVVLSAGGGMMLCLPTQFIVTGVDVVTGTSCDELGKLWVCRKNE